MSEFAAGTPFTRHTSSLGYASVPSVFTFASSRALEARIGPSAGTQTGPTLAADCFSAPESTVTFTPGQGSEAALDAEAALDEAAAVEAGAEVLGWVAAGEE